MNRSADSIHWFAMNIARQRRQGAPKIGAASGWNRAAKEQLTG